MKKYKEDAKANGYSFVNMYAASRWIISIQGLIIKDVVNSFLNNYNKIMNGQYHKELLSEGKSEKIVKFLKNIARKYIFESKETSKMEISANLMIEFLMDKFVNAIIYYDSDDQQESSVNKKYIILLSENQKHIYHKYFEKYESQMLEKLKNEIEEKNLKDLQKERLENAYKSEIFSYKLYLKLLLVTDYISGMTDTYVKTMYQEFIGIK